MTDGKKWREPTIYYFDRRALCHYADTTEPNLYPDKFEKLILAAPALEEIERLKKENEKLRFGLELHVKTLANVLKQNEELKRRLRE